MKKIAEAFDRLGLAHRRTAQTLQALADLPVTCGFSDVGGLFIEAESLRCSRRCNALAANHAAPVATAPLAQINGLSRWE
jgi:hypothetical protein